MVPSRRDQGLTVQLWAAPLGHAIRTKSLMRSTVAGVNSISGCAYLACSVMLDQFRLGLGGECCGGSGAVRGRGHAGECERSTSLVGVAVTRTSVLGDWSPERDRLLDRGHPAVAATSAADRDNRARVGGGHQRLP
jgi:hypothetical protein